MPLQTRLEPQTYLAHNSINPDVDFLPLGIRRSGIPDSNYACGYLTHAPSSAQEQSSTSNESFSRTDNLPRRWQDGFVPRTEPNVIPLEYCRHLSMSSNASVDVNFGITESIENLFIPGLPQQSAASFSTPQSPHFSWAQPDLPQPDLFQVHAHSGSLPDSSFRSQLGEATALQTPGSAVGGMVEWAPRQPFVGDAELPHLSMGLLSPPDGEYARRSPSSTSSACSSLQPAPGDLICYSCSASFANLGDLKHHLRSHQPYARRNHVCQKCDKRFQYRKDLVRKPLVDHATPALLVPQIANLSSYGMLPGTIPIDHDTTAMYSVANITRRALEGKIIW